MLKLLQQTSFAVRRFRSAPTLNVNSLPMQRRLFSTTPAITDGAAAASSVSKLDQNLYPNAPIRKFFEEQSVALKKDGSPSPIPSGRPWFASELRLKSFEDLHKLHFVLLIERTKLLNEKVRCRKTSSILPSPERIKNVKLSMARLQTVLTERARESAQLKAQQLLEQSSGSVVTQPVERKLTYAEKKWKKMHRHMKKSENHIPSPPKASGGNKTKRKMDLARVFEKDTLEYIRAIRKPTEEGVASVEVKKPRWRNLAQADVLSLRAKQAEVRNSKLGRILKAQTKQKEALDKQNRREIKKKKVLPMNRLAWPDRPELSKLILRKKEKDQTVVKRSVKGRKSAEKLRRMLAERKSGKESST